MTRQKASEHYHRLGRLEFPVFSSCHLRFGSLPLFPDVHSEPPGTIIQSTEITVIGEFQPYEENGVTWYHLVNAKMV